MSLLRIPPAILLVATGLLYLAMSLVHLVYFGAPWGATAVPDMRVTGYTPDQIGIFLDAIGEEGRAAFFGMFRVLDTVFPPLLALSLLTLFRACLTAQGGLRLALFALLPMGYLVADLTENRLLRQLGDSASFDALVEAASLGTVVKFAALALSLAVLAVLAMRNNRGTR